MKFFETVMGVYFDDLDAFYVLHNAKYLLLFERTIGAFWQEVGMGAFEPHQNGDHHHLVRTNSIEYLRPVDFTGRVRVRLWVRKIGRTSMTFAFRMMPLDEDVDFANGTRTVVRVDPESQRPIPWTDDFRKRLAPWTESA